MMMFLAFLLATIGLCHIIVDGAIFAKWRGWIVQKGPEWAKKLISCYQCTGFWSGIIVGSFMQPFSGTLWWVVGTIACGFISSYASMFAAAFLNYLDAPYVQSGNKK